MKKITFSLILTILAAFTLNAKDMSAPMKTFLEGCRAMRQAVEHNDFAALTDARLLLKKVDTQPFDNSTLRPVDEASLAAVSAPTVIFDAEYAEKMVKNKEITLEIFTDVHIMRTNGDCDLLIWNASIEPRATASYSCKALDECELLLFALSDSSLSITVTDADKNNVDITQVDGDAVTRYAAWTMPDDPADFIITLTNNADTPATFVVAVN